MTSNADVKADNKVMLCPKVHEETGKGDSPKKKTRFMYIAWC